MTDTHAPTASPSPRRLLGLIAAIMLNMVFGSLYAWSVFIAGLEHDLGILRTDVSIVFSFAIVSFTAGNFLIPFLFGRLPTPLLPSPPQPLLLPLAPPPAWAERRAAVRRRVSTVGGVPDA